MSAKIKNWGHAISTMFARPSPKFVQTLQIVRFYSQGEKNAYGHDVHDKPYKKQTPLILLQILSDDKYPLALCIDCHLLNSAITLKTLERVTVLRKHDIDF